MTSRSLKTLDQKLALIDKLRLGGAVVPGAIVPRPAPRSPVPASFGQQRLWMLERLNAGAPTYHISVALLIDQVLAPDTLQRSIAFLIGRHEALRTTFALMDGELLQQIQEPFILSLDVFDLTGHPEETRHAHAKRLGECQAREPFDLAKGPLLRTALVRLAPAKHVLVLTLHHIVADGWSVHVLLDELAAVYDALAASRSPKLRELRIQYADFAVWQRARLALRPRARRRLLAQRAEGRAAIESARRSVALGRAAGTRRT